MPNIYETGLSPLIELAKTALPGKRAVTAEDLARLLDPTTGAQRRVNVGESVKASQPMTLEDFVLRGIQDDVD